MESEICEAITQFEKDYMGRGPLETKAYIIDDMIIVRLKNALTPAEMRLASVTGSKRAYIQRLGRILRNKEGKEAVLYEIIAEETTETGTAKRRKEAISTRKKAVNKKDQVRGDQVRGNSDSESSGGEPSAHI